MHFLLFLLFRDYYHTIHNILIFNPHRQTGPSYHQYRRSNHQDRERIERERCDRDRERVHARIQERQRELGKLSYDFLC